MDRPTVVVSGASAGFGAEIARRFARQGARIVAVGRRRERLQVLADELGADDVHVLCCDIRDPETYSAALRGLPSPFSDVDVLVNNAGIGLGRDRAQEAALSDWMTMLETNVTGLIAGTQALLPGMVARNRGHVINIGSIASEHPTPRNAIYAASKAFVRQFGLCLRADLLGTMVRVTTIEPGQGGGTEFSVVRERGDASRAEQLYSGSRLLTAEDVADTVEWVASRPPHVNINVIQLMSIDQAFGPLAFAKT
jgi:3-hydroxy acid dehydrogenase / malonic semialdehyde reductase